MVVANFSNVLERGCHDAVSRHRDFWRHGTVSQRFGWANKDIHNVFQYYLLAMAISFVATGPLMWETKDIEL